MQTQEQLLALAQSTLTEVAHPRTTKVKNRGNRDPSWRYSIPGAQPGTEQWIPSITEILSDCGLLQDVSSIDPKVLKTKTIVSSAVHLAMEDCVCRASIRTWEQYENPDFRVYKNEKRSLT